MDFLIVLILIIIFNQIFISGIVRSHSFVSKKLLNNLFLFHLLFFIIYFAYSTNNRSDSMLYFIRATNIGNEWDILSTTSTHFIENFSAPFVFLGLSYYSMMFLYSWFGYLGFIFSYLYFKESIPINVKVFGKIDLLTLLLFLPNMHFWTNSLGKGSLIFMGLMMFTYAVKKPKNRIVLLLIGGFFVFKIRPAVMLFVLVGVMIGLLTGREKISGALRFFIIVGAVGFLYAASSTILHVANLENSENVVEDFNKFSEVTSTRLENSSGSGVSMNNYPLPLKLFTFWFRPLFIDSPSAIGIFSSVENLVYLLLFLKICNQRFLKFLRKSTSMVKMSAVTFFTSSFALTFVMSNLGIIMRQKSMVMYFGFFVIYYFLAMEEWEKIQKEKKRKAVTVTS